MQELNHLEALCLGRGSTHFKRIDSTCTPGNVHREFASPDLVSNLTQGLKLISLSLFSIQQCHKGLETESLI